MGPALPADMKPSIRADMVETAVRFMLGPKVRHTPLDEQRRFLSTKGRPHNIYSCILADQSFRSKR